jgi:hypothetical protein
MNNIPNGGRRAQTSSHPTHMNNNKADKFVTAQKKLEFWGHNKEKLVDFSPEFEHTALQSFNMPCIYKWVSKSSALTATKVLKLKSFKIKVVLDLQPCDSINRVNSCN